MKLLFIIKPDAMKDAIDILNYIKNQNVKILAMKTSLISESAARILYEDHQDKYYFESLISYMTLSTSMQVAIELDPNLVINFKKSVRERFRHIDWQHMLASCLNKLEEIKFSHNSDNNNFGLQFINECNNTFDVVHCSDPDEKRADKELNLFFEPKELDSNELNFDKMATIVSNKILAKLSYQNSTPSSLSFFNVSLGRQQ